VGSVRNRRFGGLVRQFSVADRQIRQDFVPDCVNLLSLVAENSVSELVIAGCVPSSCRLTLPFENTHRNARKPDPGGGYCRDHAGDVADWHVGCACGYCRITQLSDHPYRRPSVWAVTADRRCAVRGARNRRFDVAAGGPDHGQPVKPRACRIVLPDAPPLSDLRLRSRCGSKSAMPSALSRSSSIRRRPWRRGADSTDPQARMASVVGQPHMADIRYRMWRGRLMAVLE
jgi:hypothetical protein